MKAVVSLSGGIDSTTVLAWFLREYGGPVLCVSFSYGSKHNKYENEAARKVAEFYKQPLIELDITGVMAGFTSNLLKTGGDIPEGHYTEPSMSQTVVPARNIIFASILAGVAWSNEAPKVALGIHQGDHAIYPDCRPSFFYAMNRAISEGTGSKVSLLAPFLHYNKAEIVEWGVHELAVPYHLTRTCYKDQLPACGKCGSCVERLEAFKLAGGKDPVEYEGD